MLHAKLEKWAELLLDTGKRNNLINFKNRYSSVAEIVYPSPYEVFNKTLKDESFDPVTLASGEKAFPYEGMDDAELRAWYVENYQSKVTRSSDVLLYTGEVKTFNTVKNIMKKSRLALEETGVNIAYLAFGFVHWFESPTSDEMAAPLLLLPVIFESRGATKFPKIDVLETEITVNPSFSYKCEKEFGFRLPEYESQTLEDYLRAVGEVVGSLGWFVSDECKLSPFSFLKINMYRDIEDNRDKIIENENIQILLGGAPYDHTLPENDTSELHTIVDADSSQEEAIRAVKSGKSLVLQGPPGTGKSQTITNVIAECLHDGKKVLFVSEKLAALNVVYEKLKKEGLSEFCLQLHSHKANKKDFSKEICSVLKSEKFKATDRVSRELLEKNVSQDQLNEYKKQLHIKRSDIDMSLYELINGYYSQENSPSLTYNVKDAKKITSYALETKVSVLEEYIEYTKSLAYDYRTCAFYGYVDTIYSATKVNAVYESATRVLNVLGELENIREDMKNTFSLNCENLRETIELAKFLYFLGISNVMTQKLIANPHSILAGVRKLQELAGKIAVLKSEILKVFRSELLIDGVNFIIDSKTLVDVYASFSARLLSIKYNNLLKQFKSYLKSDKKLTYNELVYYVEKLEAYNDLLALYSQGEAIVAPTLGSAYKGLESDFSELINSICAYISMSVSAKFVNAISSFSAQQYNEFAPKFHGVCGRIFDLCKELDGPLRYLINLYDAKICDFNEQPIEQNIRILTAVCNDIHKLPEWINLVKLLKRAKECNVLYYLNAYIDGGYPIKNLANVYCREFYRTCAEIFIAENPVLEGFNKVVHDRTVEQFIDKDMISLEANKVRIRAKLAGLRPDLSYVAPGSEVSILLHEGAKKQKQKSIRTLLSQAGETIQLLKPCFLMSPLSVSTFLAGEGINFDVVIFDEASQIFPQDAIGSIYRGKQIVVVGDSKQMPPSNFFMNTVTGAIDDEGADDEISDYESILDICSASFAQKYLRWHYRSKHESLIAFSNSKFYNGKLISFPATQKKKLGVGVDYYNAGGVYEQNQRINRKEAEMVADLVFEHFDNNPNKSLGVVAFNMAQQGYLERVITNRRIAHPEYEKFFKEDNKEYFFIKNLETVQGDERDVIIFSVAYAYNTAGKFIHNFGPLNHKGGERRLNVAVTRAKENVKLVTSIHSTDIDLSRTEAEGARLLKEYLAYAEFGTLESVYNAYESALDGFENEVAQFIQSKGYSLDCKLGQSSAKIDIAIKDDSGEEYLLAVECDGQSYANYSNARDRDRLRKQILENSGWKYYRVWSLDWFTNRNMAKQKLLKFIKRCVISNVVNGDTFNGEEIRNAIGEYQLSDLKDMAIDFTDSPISEDLLMDVEEIVDDGSETEAWIQPLGRADLSNNYGFTVYKTADIDFMFNQNKANFKNFVKEVLKVEAPLNERWFLKRIAHLFDCSIVSDKLINRYEELMTACEYVGIDRKDGFLYLQSQTAYRLRMPSSSCKRSIDCIAIEELANGLLTIINHNGRIDKENLYLALANRLGVTKINASISSRFDLALMQLVLDIDVDGTTILKK